MSMMIEGAEYYTTAEACAVLDVKPATLYAYVSRRLLESYREGAKRRRLYRRVEVDALRTLHRPRPLKAGEGVALPNAEDWIPYT